MKAQPSFDAYHKWLGIPPGQQPPHHYRLLGIEPFEADPEVIVAAAERQIAHVQSYKIGPQSDLSQQLLNEISRAKLCLLDLAQKAEYDRSIQVEHASASQSTVPRGTVADAHTELVSDGVLLTTGYAVATSPTESVPVLDDFVGSAPENVHHLTPPRLIWGIAGALFGSLLTGVLLLYLLGTKQQTANRQDSLDQRPIQVAYNIIEEGHSVRLFGRLFERAEVPGRRYVLEAGHPEGVSINSTTGEVRWTPSNGQGPGNYAIVVSSVDVDESITPLKARFRIVVTRANRAPTIVPNTKNRQQLTQGEALSLVVTAIDEDLPGSSLRFELGQGAPSGARLTPIDSRSMLLTWVTSIADNVGIYEFEVLVEDDGEPSLRASQFFSVSLLPATNAVAGNLDGMQQRSTERSEEFDRDATVNQQFAVDRAATESTGRPSVVIPLLLRALVGRSESSAAMTNSALPYKSSAVTTVSAPATEFELRAKGVFGFPQQWARVVCDRSDLRVSVVNDDENLLVQAILWEDESDELYEARAGRMIGDNSTIVLDLDDDGRTSANRDRRYHLNGHQDRPGLSYDIELAGGNTTYVKSDSAGHGCIAHLSLGKGSVRIDTFVVPLAEIGLRPDAAIRIGFIAQSAGTFPTSNSTNATRSKRRSYDIPYSRLHQVKLLGVPSRCDVLQIPDGRQLPSAFFENPKSRLPAPE